MNINRDLNAFEKLLLIVGLGIGLVGFFFIHFLFRADNNVVTWNMLSIVFVWLILIFLVIACAILENMREETALIIHKHSEETRLLRRITEELNEEIKLLRIDVGYTHNKIVDSHERIHTHLAKPKAATATKQGTATVFAKKKAPSVKKAVTKKTTKKKR